MLKGESKCYLNTFYKKEGVDYHNHQLQVGMSFNQYSKNKDLIYYKYTFLPITNTVSAYIQEYAYNHIAHIVDYRDTDGVKWQKQYTDSGFDIVYKDMVDKRAYSFDYKKNKLIKISSKGVKEIIDTSMCSTISIIDGVDYSDRFILHNKSLLKYFINEMDYEDIISKILSFKDINIQNEVLNYINMGENENENKGKILQIN